MGLCPTLSDCEGWKNRLSKTTMKIEQAIEPTVEQMGYRLVDVEIGKEEDSKVLYVYVDREGGVSLDDCADISHAIDPILDELDPIEESYFLCVSSPGIDRPLKKPADFLHALGKEMELRLYQPFEGKKKWIGTLQAYDSQTDEVTLACEEATLTFPRKQIALIKPYIVF